MVDNYLVEWGGEKKGGGGPCGVKGFSVSSSESGVNFCYSGAGYEGSGEMCLMSGRLGGGFKEFVGEYERLRREVEGEESQERHRLVRLFMMMDTSSFF